MYSTCLFCGDHLGANEVIEHFPIGRRLAFDAAKGRLWVVCRKCERWNLTPIEERWEAIEEAERLFRETRLRVSTDNIGMAKVREGLELVRIGSALRPEMAAWRYGDQFGRRRKKHLMLTGAGVAAVAGLVVLGPVTGVIAGGGWGTWQVISSLHGAYQQRRVRVRLRVPEYPETVVIRKKQLEKAAVVRADDEWAIRVQFQAPVEPPFNRAESRRFKMSSGRELSTLLRGAEALNAAGKLLPAINEDGAKVREVQSAVTIVSEAGDPDSLFRRYAGGSSVRKPTKMDGGHVLNALPKEVRLALEMASHEEQERRALEGELALLEAAWREAEEVAAISDDLFLPEGTAQRLEEIKKKG
jgi:hypothetical protein